MRKLHRFTYDLETNSVTTYFRGYDQRDGIEPHQVFTYKDQEIEDMDEVIDNIIDHQEGRI